MLLCPPQYHTSPYVTWVRLAEFPLPSVARIVQLPPLGPGTLALHVLLKITACVVMVGQPAPETFTVTAVDIVWPNTYATLGVC
jgi:hypothetical protein